MKYLATVTLFVTPFVIMLMMAGRAQAETNLTPEMVRDRYPLIVRGGCKDIISQEVGWCYLFQAPEGHYMVFVQNNTPVFMRFVPLGASEFFEVWRSRPSGTSL